MRKASSDEKGEDEQDMPMNENHCPDDKTPVMTSSSNDHLLRTGTKAWRARSMNASLLPIGARRLNSQARGISKVGEKVRRL